MKMARRRRLARENVVGLVERPPDPRRHKWVIFTPEQVAAVELAFRGLIAEASDPEERAWIEQARVVFLTAYTLGLRRGEILGLRWRRIRLADPEGAHLRVDETFVRHATDTPKSAASERTIPVGQMLADELFQHRGRSSFVGDDERVFCHGETGGALDMKRYTATFRAAVARAGIEGYVRPLHDGRHTAITNSAAAGNTPTAIQAHAGHSDFSTTQRYIDLAGVVFRDEAKRAEQRTLERLPKPAGSRLGIDLAIDFAPSGNAP